MEYTHYWKTTRDFTDQEWTTLMGNTYSILGTIYSAEDPIPLCDGSTGSPVIGTHGLVFNGLADDSYETFILEKSQTDFSGCKTANKPYDVVVVAVLLLAAFVSDAITVTSDGEESDLWAGLLLATTANRDVRIPDSMK